MILRRFSGDTLVLATHNCGKVDELVALLAPYGVTVRSASEFGLVAPEETEATFVGNARIKAHHVAAATGLPALADDSGIAIDALGGARTGEGNSTVAHNDSRGRNSQGKPRDRHTSTPLPAIHPLWGSHSPTPREHAANTQVAVRARARVGEWMGRSG